MLGWAPDGTRVQLTPAEEEHVLALLGWGESRTVVLSPIEAGARSVVLATAGRLDVHPLTGKTPSVAEVAEFRRQMILALNDPDVERAVHQAVARRQAEKAKRAAGTNPGLRAVGRG